MKRKILAGIVLPAVALVFLYFSFIPDEEILVDHANSNLDNMPCEVFFFKRWGTYSHPVTPIEPIEFEEAIGREGFCMAWMCTNHGKKQFSQFQVRENNIVATELLKPEPQGDTPKFYALVEENGKQAVGRVLDIDDVVNSTGYLIAFPGTDQYLSLNKQLISYTYRYLYREDGSLKQAVITNELGKVNTINY